MKKLVLLTVIILLSLAQPASAVNKQTLQIREINKYRQQRNLPHLRYDPVLSRAAQVRAERMAGNNYFSHKDPDRRHDLFNTLTRFGYPWTSPVYEIIAGETSSTARCVELWDSSKLHREAMLSQEHFKIGCGYAYNPKSQYKHYWVAIIGN